jgi:hypothetical protein
MRRVRTLILVVTAAALLAGGWYFGSPWWTLWRMREAAEARDSEALAAYVDFPALRASSKRQLRRELGAEASRAGESGDGLAALGAAFGAAVAGPAVDALLTPEALRRLFAAAPEREAGAERSGRRNGDERAREYALSREGFDRFRLHRNDRVGEQGDLLFRRHGLRWKLEEIRLERGSGR